MFQELSYYFLLFRLVLLISAKKELLPSSSLIITAASLPSSLSFILVFVCSEHRTVVFSCPLLFRGHSWVCFFMTKFLRVKRFYSRVISFMSWRNPLPSTLRSTLDIPSWLLSNMYIPLTFMWASASHWLGYVWGHYDWVLMVTQYATCLTEKWQAMFSRYY